MAQTTWPRVTPWGRGGWGLCSPTRGWQEAAARWVFTPHTASLPGPWAEWASVLSEKTLGQKVAKIGRELEAGWPAPRW